MVFGLERANPEELPFPARGIRTDDYLSMRIDEPERSADGRTRPAQELYDLQKDTWQMQNVARDASYAQVTEDLAQRLHRELVRTQDPRALGHRVIFDQYPARAWDPQTHQPNWDRLEE